MQYYEGLINSLKRGLVAPVYLFYGEEEYLKERALENFIHHLLPQAADFNLDILDGTEVEPASVVALAENMPFFADKRLVLVKNSPWFKGADKTKGNEAKIKEEKNSGKEEPLLNYLANPSPSTCLIFTAGASVDRRKKLYKTIETVGQAIDFKALKPVEMTSWVIDKCKAQGKKINSTAAKNLVEANGKLGLLNLYNEVEKIITYAGERTDITISDVEAVAVKNIDQNIFAVVDDAVSGNLAKALGGINDLLAMKEPPQKILSMLGRQFRLALLADALVQENKSEREIASMLGVHDFVAKKSVLQARRSGTSKLEWALEQLVLIDAGIKKGKHDFLPALENTLINISQR